MSKNDSGMIKDAGVYPSNSGQRKGPWGDSKQVTANSPQFNPVIKGPKVPAQGAGDCNTPNENKTSDYW